MKCHSHFFFFNDTATTEIYTLSLHDALPISNAVYDAVGVRIDEVPITPEKVFKALRRKEKGEAPRFGPTAFPEIAWPEPTRVPPPWEGGDGKAVEGGGGRAKAVEVATRHP